MAGRQKKPTEWCVSGFEVEYINRSCIICWNGHTDLPVPRTAKSLMSRDNACHSSSYGLRSERTVRTYSSRERTVRIIFGSRLDSHIVISMKYSCTFPYSVISILLRYPFSPSVVSCIGRCFGKSGFFFLHTMAAKWTTHIDCPASLKTRLEAYVWSLPASYLIKPKDGEEFDNVKLCNTRL